MEFVCDKAFESQSRGLMEQALAPVSVSTIAAGKLRRYHGESLLDRLRDVRTIAFNIRDGGYIAVGFFQSLWRLIRNRPDVVFAKGGYVCLPMGLAAALLRIPLVIHDSDTRPGLTNRVLARFAGLIGTGSPVENYNYDRRRTRYVGVPIKEVFRPMSSNEIRAARRDIGMIDVTAPLVVVTGGGLGAKSINEAMVRSGQYLIDRGVHVYHVTGKRDYDGLQHRLPDHPHYHAVAFVFENMHQVLGAGDVVISRGSATFLQELAGLRKPVIIVPAAHLGDQVKNAAVYREAKAAVVITDQEVSKDATLGVAAMKILTDKPLRQKMSQNLHQFARPHAARDMAAMIMSVQKGVQ